MCHIVREFSVVLHATTNIVILGTVLPSCYEITPKYLAHCQQLWHKEYLFFVLVSPCFLAVFHTQLNKCNISLLAKLLNYGYIFIC